jgi:hypothetical protein
MHETASRQREYDRLQGLQRARTAAWAEKMPFLEGRTLTWAICCAFSPAIPLPSIPNKRIPTGFMGERHTPSAVHAACYQKTDWFARFMKGNPYDRQERVRAMGR